MPIWPIFTCKKTHFTAFSWVLTNKYASLWSFIFNLDMLNGFWAKNNNFRRKNQYNLSQVKNSQFWPIFTSKKTHFRDFRWVSHKKYASIWSYIFDMNAPKWFLAINHHFTKEVPGGFDIDQKQSNLIQNRPKIPENDFLPNFSPLGPKINIFQLPKLILSDLVAIIGTICLKRWESENSTFSVYFSGK